MSPNDKWNRYMDSIVPPPSTPAARELEIERIVARAAIDDLISTQAEQRRERSAARLLWAAVVFLTLALVWVGGRSVRAINDCGAPLENSTPVSQNGVEVWI